MSRDLEESEKAVTDEPVVHGDRRDNTPARCTHRAIPSHYGNMMEQQNVEPSDYAV